MSTNSNESFPRRVEGSSRQLNTRVSSWLRIMAFRIFGLESSTMKHMIHMMTMMGMMDGMTRMIPECPIMGVMHNGPHGSHTTWAKRSNLR